MLPLPSALFNHSSADPTYRYNAPEVAAQENLPIPVEQLHKCDIWAFGLCVWEILANGQLYFKRNWLTDSTFHRTPSLTSSSSTLSMESKSQHENPINEDDQKSFDRFDLSQLRELALNFVDEMIIPGIGFEKGFLRPLLSGTLQPDPIKRISDLSRMPIIGFWNRLPGSHSLQSKLATYTLSGDIRYSIFNKDGGPYIIWEQQMQLLQDFEAVAQKNDSLKNGSASFQTMLCYVNAFGTSMDLQKATQFLDMAKNERHLVAKVLGPRLLSGFAEQISESLKDYSDCLARGFMMLGQPGKSEPISVHHGESVTEFSDYSSLRDAFESEGAFVGIDPDDIKNISLTESTSPGHKSLLETVIQHGDAEMVRRITPGKRLIMKERECPLVQAARQGHGNIVKYFLKEKIPIARDDSTSCLLHWLFCLDDPALREVQRSLSRTDSRDDLDLAINHAITSKAPLHPQWPFQVHGTPLATAISSGSIAAVKLLLALKADPTASAYARTDNETEPKLTPIHLAISHQNPEMIKMLWKAAFGRNGINSSRIYLDRSLGRFPIACALSLTTKAERFAMHGNKYRQNLRETIKLLPKEAFCQSTPEGKNAITQAIDLEDVEVLEIIMGRYPELAARKITQPGSSMFTYPLHFAAQIGSFRGTEESVQILQSIIKLDPTAVTRPDSSSTKPIHIAAMGTSVRILELFLDAGAKCHDQDGRGQTPLFFCSSADIAKELLKIGARINHKDKLGFTPAHAATNNGAEEVLQALIDARAKLTIGAKDIGTPLHFAVKRKSLSMTETLLKAGVDVNAKDSHGQTPLLIAMDTGRSDLVSILFENGADPFIVDKSGSSALHMALAWPNASILNKFQIGQRLNTLPWSAKVAALHFGAQKGEPAALRLFLSKALRFTGSEDGAELFYHRDIEIAVHKATSAGRADLLEALLDHGLRVNPTDANGNTPLIVGCRIDREEPSESQYSRAHICELLVNRGADILKKNKNGASAFSIAQGHADYPLMTLLMEHALKDGDLDSPKLRPGILESLKNPDKDQQYSEECRELIGNEMVDMNLLQQAAQNEEWEFFMTCIGGLFVTKSELLKIFARRTWSFGVDSVDLLRFHCSRRDREIVRYLHQTSLPGPSNQERPLQFGRRNLQAECSDSRISLNHMLWPKKMAELSAKLKRDEASPEERAGRSIKRCKKFRSKDPRTGKFKWGSHSPDDSSSDDSPTGSGVAGQTGDEDTAEESKDQEDPEGSGKEHPRDIRQDSAATPIPIPPRRVPVAGMSSTS